MDGRLRGKTNLPPAYRPGQGVTIRGDAGQPDAPARDVVSLAGASGCQSLACASGCPPVLVPDDEFRRDAVVDQVMPVGDRDLPGGADVGMGAELRLQA